MRTKKEQGQLLIISVIFLSVILVLVGALMTYVGQNARIARTSLASEQALQLADAGVDKAVWRLNNTGGTYSGETGTVLGAGVFDVSVASLTGSLKEITATAYAPNKITPQAVKQVKVQVSINTSVVSFNYGVQVGAGGLNMSNNSRIIGNVYSNGVIDGDSGAVITGDAYSAGPSGRIFDQIQIDGNAHARQIDSNVSVGGSAFGYAMTNVTVGGNIKTYSMSSCTVGGSAWYTTKTSCTVGGSQTTPYPGESDPAIEPFPISDSQITDWKAAATAGGTIAGNYTLTNGAQGALGPKKITGNLTLSNNAKLTLTGPIWVAGNIDISNNAIVALAASYGNNSEVMIADGLIDVSNNAIFQKAGPTSYILMITTYNSATVDAFDVANNADALISYAPNGIVDVSNNAQLREVTGWRLKLANNSTVTYETGLSSVVFSGGPGGSWVIVRGTWRTTD